MFDVKVYENDSLIGEFCVKEHLIPRRGNIVIIDSNNYIVIKRETIEPNIVSLHVFKAE